MKSKLLDQEGGRKTFAVIFDEGDEVRTGLLSFAREQGLAAAQLTGIGGFRTVVLGYFELARQQYKRIPIDEQVEVVSLLGDIARKGGGGDDGDQPALHAHLVVGKSDGSAWGGHLLEAYVRPTLEIIVRESPAHLQRKSDPRFGIALISL